MRFSKPLLLPPAYSVALPVRRAPSFGSYFGRLTGRAPIPRTRRSGLRRERASTHFGDSRGRAFAAGLTRHIPASVPPWVPQRRQAFGERAADAR